MADLTICSQVSWLDHFLEQKLHLFSLLSSTSYQARLCSGDGFSVSLPAHLLLAASKVARDTFIPGQACQDMLLPSVRGSTLLLLVELLRSGMTGNLGMMDNLGHRLNEVQEAMTLLEIQGCVALTRDDCSFSESKTKLRSVPNFQVRRGKVLAPPNVKLARRDDIPNSLNPVVKVTQIKVKSNFVNMGLSQMEIDQECNEIKIKEEFPGLEMTGSEDTLIDQMKESVLPTECHVCKKKFMKRDSLKQHIRSVHKDSMFPCENCDIKFILECNLKEHIIRAHQGNRISCDHCKSTYRKKESLRDHMRKSHRNKLLSCTECDKHFIMETTLRAHVRSSHSANQHNRISCVHCKRTYLNKESFCDHMRKSHKNLMLSCKYCNMHFFKENTLRIHIKNSHAKTQFQCGECPAKFSRKARVQIHMRNVHSGILLVCKQCRSTFSSKSTLKRHMKTVHNDSLDSGDIGHDQLDEDGNAMKDIEVCANMGKLNSE